MGTALVIIKMMPTSPDVDLEVIQTKVREVIAEKQGNNVATRTEPVAFGLNAIVVNFAMDESMSVDDFEDALKEIEGVNSAEVTDFRRAFG